MAETQARIQLFSKDDAAVKAAQANHILDKDKRFVYQKWDAQASKLVTDPDKKGLTLEEVMAILTELRKLSNDQTITKFNASRRLRKKKQPKEDHSEGLYWLPAVLLDLPRGAGVVQRLEYGSLPLLR